MSKKKVSRREFVSDSSKVAAAAMFLPGEIPTIVPRHVLGGKGHIAPSDKLNIAIVGVGGMGRGNAGAMLSENLVAFCDVDIAASEKQINQDAQAGRDGRINERNVALLAAF